MNIQTDLDRAFLQSLAQVTGAPTAVPFPDKVCTKANEFWQLLETKNLVSTFRAEVPGGWLVYQSLRAHNDIDKSSIGAMTFISDPQHTWQMRSEFK